MSLISFFATVEDDVKRVETWLAGTSWGQDLITIVTAAVNEFETSLGANSKAVFQAMVTAALGGLATGGIPGAEAAALAAGEQGVQAAGVKIATDTLAVVANHAATTARTNAAAAVAAGTPIAAA